MEENNYTMQNRPTVNYNGREESKNRRDKAKFAWESDEIFSASEVVDGFVLADSEYAIRRYHAFKTTGDSNGVITVTNKRVLFDTCEKAEVPVDCITSIRTIKGSIIKKAKLIWGIILFLLGAAIFVVDLLLHLIPPLNPAWLTYVIWGVGGVLALIGLILGCSCVKRKFGISVYVKEQQQFANFSTAPDKKGSLPIGSYIESTPGSEFEKMRREIGALIIDIKSNKF